MVSLAPKAAFTPTVIFSKRDAEIMQLITKPTDELSDSEIPKVCMKVQHNTPLTQITDLEYQSLVDRYLTVIKQNDIIRNFHDCIYDARELACLYYANGQFSKARQQLVESAKYSNLDFALRNKVEILNLHEIDNFLSKSIVSDKFQGILKVRVIGSRKLTPEQHSNLTEAIKDSSSTHKRRASIIIFDARVKICNFFNKSNKDDQKEPLTAQPIFNIPFKFDVIKKITNVACLFKFIGYKNDWIEIQEFLGVFNYHCHDYDAAFNIFNSLLEKVKSNEKIKTYLYKLIIIVEKHLTGIPNTPQYKFKKKFYKEHLEGFKKKLRDTEIDQTEIDRACKTHLNELDNFFKTKFLEKLI